MTTHPLPAGSAAQGGRAIGAMFFSAFGGVWLALWGYSEFSPPFPVLAAVAMGTVALMVWSLATYRQNAEALRSDAGTPEAKRRSRLFNLINGGQWVVIFVLASLLGWLQHPESSSCRPSSWSSGSTSSRWRVCFLIRPTTSRESHSLCWH